MTWAKVDDGFWCHPKVDGLSYEARGVWVTVLSWCAHYRTDGAIPRRLAKMLELPQSAVDELVAEEMWDETDRGWEIHDYLEFNPSKAEIDVQRAKGRRRADQSRDRRGKTRTDSSGERSPNQAATVRPLPIPIPIPIPIPDPDPEIRVWRAFAKVRGVDPVLLGRVDLRSCAAISAAISASVGSKAGSAWDKALEGLMRAWASDPFVASKQGVRLAHLAGDPARYLAKPGRSSGGYQNLDEVGS